MITFLRVLPCLMALIKSARPPVGLGGGGFLFDLLTTTAGLAGDTDIEGTAPEGGGGMLAMVGGGGMPEGKLGGAGMPDGGGGGTPPMAGGDAATAGGGGTAPIAGGGGIPGTAGAGTLGIPGGGGTPGGVGGTPTGVSLGRGGGISLSLGGSMVGGGEVLIMAAAGPAGVVDWILLCVGETAMSMSAMAGGSGSGFIEETDA